ncbi:KH domain-containing protein [Leptolyngbya sp. PCC 6406]|uniref:KH domain-containing protein n=1 Tax=Leptolyngbya sp. PCC 6406 TaxID=1173264 RepID=UPI001CED5616|nr:KH domain-containing protein [Leptolyngbya sp. PCC 6406]
MVNPVAPSPPDYPAMVRFLMEPFLEVTDSLKIDCETAANASKVWVRVAFEGDDRGRVFGRGGRNIQAIRTVLRATAAIAGQVAHLDVYGMSPADEEHHAPRHSPPHKSAPHKSAPQNNDAPSRDESPRPRPRPRPRTQGD